MFARIDFVDDCRPQPVTPIKNMYVANSKKKSDNPTIINLHQLVFHAVALVLARERSVHEQAYGKPFTLLLLLSSRQSYQCTFVVVD